MNPNSGIRADLCVVMLVRVEHMLNVGIDSLKLLPSRVYLFISRHGLMKRPRPTLRVLLRETGSTPDIRLVPYMWLGGCSFSDFSGHGICKRGPRKGVIETVAYSMLWFDVRRYETVHMRKP